MVVAQEGVKILSQNGVTSLGPLAQQGQSRVNDRLGPLP
jgi:hypothetical protein